ncbi:MAG: DUF2752 domain-containing protein [Alistipes sp.]|nr:DUF2752 domain-containing protein [Alistipes sp.]
MKRPIIAKIKLGVLILLPFFLYVVPTEGIYNGESLCLIKRCFGVECWGCGITRAIFSVLYGNFAEAWCYNRLIVIVFPLLLWLWGKEIYKTIRLLRAKK